MQKSQLWLSSLSMYTLNSWLCAFYMHIIRTTNEVIIMWLQIIVNKGRQCIMISMKIKGSEKQTLKDKCFGLPRNQITIIY